MAKKEINKQKLLWIDMEMTGLDPLTDRILEVAAIVTDWDLQETGTLELVVRQDQALVEQKLSTEFWLANEAARQGLIEQNSSGMSEAEAEKRLVGFIKEQFELDAPQGDIILAGNSVSFDKQFLSRHFPRAAEYLHYRVLDVSSFKVWHDAKYNRVYAKSEDHRALEDIRGSIAELKFLTRFEKGA